MAYLCWATQQGLAAMEVWILVVLICFACGAFSTRY